MGGPADFRRQSALSRSSRARGQQRSRPGGGGSAIPCGLYPDPSTPEGVWPAAEGSRQRRPTFDGRRIRRSPANTSLDGPTSGKAGLVRGRESLVHPALATLRSDCREFRRFGIVQVRSTGFSASAFPSDWPIPTNGTSVQRRRSPQSRAPPELRERSRRPWRLPINPPVRPVQRPRRISRRCACCASAPIKPPKTGSRSSSITTGRGSPVCRPPSPASRGR